MSEENVSVIAGIPSWDLARWREAATNLNAELDALKSKHQQTATLLSDRSRQHRSDVEKIGQALIKEANEREWCSQYDDLIDELNTELYEPLPVRMRTYDVTLMVTRTQSQEVVIQVECRDDNDAIGLAEEQFNDDPHLYLSDYDWDSDDEFEIEESGCEEV